MSSLALGELVVIKGGGTPNRKELSYWNGDVPWATVKDFKTTVLAETQETITKKGVENSATNIIPARTIVVPTRMAVGKAAVTSIDMAINQDLKALIIRDDKKIDQQYLLRFLLGKARDLAGMAKGATVKGITLDVLREMKIPLPPLPEQKRIAAILDKADAIRRKRQQAIELADQFLRSVFLEMFGDPVTNKHDFQHGTIRDLVETVNYGTSSKADPEQGRYPILRMGNITYAGKMDFSDIKYIDLTEMEEKKYLVKKGDLLFNRTNSKDLVGKSAVFDCDTPMAFAGYLIRIRTNQIGNPYYLSGYLNSLHGKQTLRHICKSIVGMANINAQELQDIKILLPPTSLQDRYSTVVRAVRSTIETMEISVKEIHDLFVSLSNKAFAGDLKTND